MGGREDGLIGRAPAPGGPAVYANGSDNWTHVDKSVNAVYFGFVATAILVFMFFVMGVFERFLAPNSSSPADGGGSGRTRGAASGGEFTHHKLDYPSPKVSVNAIEVSVLMPGNTVPTFIAHPAPVSCPPESVSWHSHRHSSDLEAPSPSTSA